MWKEYMANSTVQKRNNGRRDLRALLIKKTFRQPMSQACLQT